MPAQILAHLWRLGYSPEDVIGNIFRVCKTFQMPEYLKLEFIKVSIKLVTYGVFLSVRKRGWDSYHRTSSEFSVCCMLVQKNRICCDCFLSYSAL